LGLADVARHWRHVFKTVAKTADDSASTNEC
jgi:hypothetical protein